MNATKDNERPKNAKTYNSGDSLVVTDPTTNPPHCSLCKADRTGCPVFYKVWSYVLGKQRFCVYNSCNVIVDAVQSAQLLVDGVSVVRVFIQMLARWTLRLLASSGR